MKEFDKIIGYSSIKKELKQIADIFKNREVYNKLGVMPPRGVLIHGVPGVGKSLMASVLIEASGLNMFICRKDKPNGDFVNTVKSTFDKAEENAPAIVFLDDMDKFANGDEDHPDSEEYVTVQSCIDNTKGKEVFVLATANNLHCLPDSLLRAGRFDRMIEVNTPEGKDVEEIVKYYLSQKKVSAELDIKAVAKIMRGHSCAELETVINEAGIYAGFERMEYITMDHFLKAAMRVLFDVPITALDGENDFAKNSKTLKIIAYHEVGHALIHEVLDPGSVTIVSVHGKTYGDFGGFTTFDFGDGFEAFKRQKIRIIAELAGIAASEQKLGITDVGSTRDLRRAFDRVRDLIVNSCISGFHLHGEYGEYSDELRARQEYAVATEVERYYRKAKEIIALNNEFFDEMVSVLMNKKILCAKDIEDVRSKCKIVSVDI